MSKNSKIYIFVGPPGSGKGSLAKLCVDRLNWQQLSTGNLCRKHIAEQTEIGKGIDAALKAGQLVKDELIIRMVDSWILDNIAKVPALILDGYPRTLVQAEAFKKLHDGGELPSCSVRVLLLNLSDDEVLKRLLQRATCSNRECQRTYSLISGSGLTPQRDMTCDSCGNELKKRNDDDRVAITERLKTYYRHEQDLLDFYRRSNVMINDLQVTRPILDIFQDVLNIFACDAV